MFWCFEPDLGGIQLFLVQNRSYLKPPSLSLLFVDLFDGPQIGQAAKKAEAMESSGAGEGAGGLWMSDESMTQSGEKKMTQPLLQTSGIESYDVPWENIMYRVFAYIDPRKLPKSIDMLWYALSIGSLDGDLIV